MPAVSSAERSFDVPAGVRVAMVGLGFLPALHVVSILAPVVWAIGWSAPRAAWLVPFMLYLLPPLVVRVVLWQWPLPAGLVALSSRAFLRWWCTAQCQIVFSRLPWLEEVLRLIPGLYSAWLRLWGARVGSLVYWSPGVAVLDRSLLHVGDRVAVGAGARIVSHVVGVAPDGGAALLVAPVTIGADALIGAYSTLLPGCVIDAGEVTPPFRSVHAFSRWTRGRRSRLPNSPLAESTDAEPR
jgi:hypothetical protein